MMTLFLGDNEERDLPLRVKDDDDDSARFRQKRDDDDNGDGEILA